jgi:hypothetical protein
MIPSTSFPNHLNLYLHQFQQVATLQSTKAKMESSVILLYITSSRLCEGTWNGTTESFIFNWQNQVWLYGKHVPPSDHFSDGQKRIMLQNAVNGIMELRQAKNTADQMGNTSGSMLTYDAYTTLLLYAASAYDDQFKATKSKQHVMLHKIQHDESGTDDDQYHGNDLLFDIDCHVSSIRAFATNFRPNSGSKSTLNKVCMPSNKWFSLRDSNKAIWDRLDDPATGIILAYVTPTYPDSSLLPSFSKPPFSRTSTGKSGFAKSFAGKQTHLHEISAYNFLFANMHELDCSADVEADPNEESVDPPPEDDHSDTRLIHTDKSKGKPIHPGEIRCVLSKASTSHVNIAQTQYHVSFHDSLTVKNLSLIDQGANGGVAGENVLVIFCTSCTVDIKGIDNHHVNDIGIGTVGGVVYNQKDPVIAIIHQYALSGRGSSIHSPSQLEW